MKKIILATLLVAACSTGSAQATLPPVVDTPDSFYRVLEDWSGDKPQVRVIEVRVKGRMIPCVQAREFHSEYGSNGPDTAGIGLSCDWSAR